MHVRPTVRVSPSVSERVPRSPSKVHLAMLAIGALALAAAWTAPVHLRARARPPSMTGTPAASRTEDIMRNLPQEAQSGGAVRAHPAAASCPRASQPDPDARRVSQGGQTTYEALLRLDAAWAKLRAGEMPPVRDVVFEEPSGPSETAEFDVVVCGGNIGILLATALVLRGLRVAVLEGGLLRGREQDWNASRKEVLELVEAGVLSPEEGGTRKRKTPFGSPVGSPWAIKCQPSQMLDVFWHSRFSVPTHMKRNRPISFVTNGFQLMPP